MDTKPKSTRSRKTAAPAKTTRTAAKPRVRAAGTPGGEPPAPTHEQIAARAHELYVQSGHQHGREQEFWLEAERQLKDEANSLSV